MTETVHYLIYILFVQLIKVFNKSSYKLCFRILKEDINYEQIFRCFEPISFKVKREQLKLNRKWQVVSPF